MRLTIVTGSFSADHFKPYGAHRHGHDWHVRLALPEAGHKDGPQARLDQALAGLDHRFLDELIPDATNEGVAECLGEQLGAAWVYVWRFERGREFGAEWRPCL